MLQHTVYLGSLSERMGAGGAANDMCSEMEPISPQCDTSRGSTC